MPKITNRIVSSVSPGQKDVFVWDSELAGFGLRVLPSGRRSYVIQYRAGGRQRRFTIGPHGVFTPTQARQRAAKLLADVRDGGDPAERRHEETNAPTLAQFSETYLERHARPKKKKSSAKEDERLFAKEIVPVLGKRRMASLTHADVDRFHASLHASPVTANRALALLSTTCQMAERWGVMPPNSNPCRGVKRYKERPRERYLSSVEVARLGDLLRELERYGSEPPDVIAAIRLLILTGARRGEIVNLRWDEVDLDRGLLQLTDSKTGPKRIILNAPACEILASVERTGECVFPKLVGIGGQKLWLHWKHIRASAELKDVTLHDLRHSFASVGAAAGMGLPIIGKLLGHTLPRTTARYAHLSDDPLREASELIGRRIAADLDGRPDAEVVELAQR